MWKEHTRNNDGLVSCGNTTSRAQWSYLNSRLTTRQFTHARSLLGRMCGILLPLQNPRTSMGTLAHAPIAWKKHSDHPLLKKPRNTVVSRKKKIFSDAAFKNAFNPRSIQKMKKADIGEKWNEFWNFCFTQIPISCNLNRRQQGMCMALTVFWHSTPLYASA